MTDSSITREKAENLTDFLAGFMYSASPNDNHRQMYRDCAKAIYIQEGALSDYIADLKVFQIFQYYVDFWHYIFDSIVILR